MRRERLTLIVLCGLFAAVTTAWAGAGPPLSVLKGPYLQDVTTDAITVMWETTAPSDSRVEYGTTSSYGADAGGAEPAALHEVRLTGLSADATYHYRVVSKAAAGGSVSSIDHVFQTAAGPSMTAFRFVAYGDSRTQAARHARVVKAIIASKPRLVLHTGDLVTDGKKDDYWQTDFFNPAQQLMANTVLFPIQGNHEGDSPFYYQYFDPPKGGGEHNEQWYAFTYGNAKFIGVDTQTDFSPGSPQYAWLTKELRDSGGRWLFVFQHTPAYSSGYHGGNEKVQRYLVPLYEKYRVAMVFMGHDHIYERSVKSGIQYVVTGGGGAPLYAPGAKPNPYQVHADSRYHYCTVDITGDTATFRAVDIKGKTFDHVTMTRAAAPVE